MDEPDNPVTEAVKSNNIPARLLISVTRRLFIALVILYGLSLTAAALLRESIYIVPLLVFASGVIGGFVGLQRRL
ncbi:MAG TPA: hypothetical protein VF243_07175, partial [Nitrosospira sp.]